MAQVVVLGAWVVVHRTEWVAFEHLEDRRVDRKSNGWISSVSGYSVYSVCKNTIWLETFAGEKNFHGVASANLYT